MVLESIELRNFQAHEHRRVDFSPGVTTIVGPSDVGKTAIIRALRWVCQNTPQGTAFVRTGEPVADVRLCVDGHMIGRRRARTGDNVYDLDGREFKAFGYSVPDPIAAVLNVSDVNFQDQLDQSFWLSLSAGEVSRQLNAVVDLTIIDSSLEEVNRRFRSASQLVETRKEILNKAKETKLGLDWVTDADAELKRVEQADADHAAVRGECIQLRNMVDLIVDKSNQLRDAKDKLDQLNTVGRAAAGLMKIQTRRQELSADVAKFRRMTVVTDRGAPDIRSMTDAADVASKSAGHAKLLRQLIRSINQTKATTDRGIPDISRLDSTARDYSRSMTERSNLLVIVTQIARATTTIAEKRSKLQLAATELQEITQGMCPVCGKPME